ncbi:MAG TPA: lipopolysaccharide kinase InaA family protein [candidate division Zixibacteria bacterium]|nr:lipopolysaccharide kinase InaA family protein [candidate division Zixibacteria bacterium]
MIVREDVRSLIPPDLWQGSAPQEESRNLAGRSRLRAFRLANGETALIREYRHGGLLRAVTGGVFLGRPLRPFRELAVTEELRRRGFPTVEVYVACVRKVWGPFYRGWLVTRELDGARDFWAALNDGFVKGGNREEVLRAVGRSVRALHREGVYHRDLNLKNILLREENGRIRGYVIDFDRAVLFLGGVPRPLAERNLERLLRSALKLDPERKLLAPDAWAELVRCYREADE